MKSRNSKGIRTRAFAAGSEGIFHQPRIAIRPVRGRDGGNYRLVPSSGNGKVSGIRIRSNPVVIPGWSEGPDPESRDSGFEASQPPAMTDSGRRAPQPPDRAIARA